ncbi:MAG: glycosyltransferase [Verrucomicrobia bacterium]|nr:glycosyltransferase [Verrucomicrobiota bacterium]
MKISIATGFFLPVPPVAGGATEKIWHRLAQEFAAAGHEVTFISRTWPGFAARETVARVTHLRIRGADHTPSLARNLWHDFWWGVRVARALPPADVVILNLVALPAWLGRLKPSAGKVVAVVARMPKGQGRVYGGVDLLFSLSAAVTAKLCLENPRLAPRIVPFPFPIDWARHARATAKATSPAPLTIGYVGRLHPEKGLRVLLAAAARLASRADLPAWRLEIVGPWTVPQGGGGEAYRDALIAEFAPALGARLVFTGPEFDAEKLARRYGGMDIFCYPSLAEKGETFGVSVAEAMAAKAAVVVSGLACFHELVRDGDTGLVFNHAAPGADVLLADALARLLLDPAFRTAVAARGQAHARQFDYAESARTVLNDLARITAAQPSGST